MRILTPGFVARYAGRLLNIHPSLLPAFPGLHTHQRAIEAGCKVAGLTVHQVTVELDHGPILAQAVVPVLPDDTADEPGRTCPSARTSGLPAGNCGLAGRNKMTQSRRSYLFSSSLAKRSCDVPSISTRPPNMAAGRTQSPRSP